MTMEHVELMDTMQVDVSKQKDIRQVVVLKQRMPLCHQTQIQRRNNKLWHREQELAH